MASTWTGNFPQAARGPSTPSSSRYMLLLMSLGHRYALFTKGSLEDAFVFMFVSHSVVFTILGDSDLADVRERV